MITTPARRHRASASVLGRGPARRARSGGIFRLAEVFGLRKSSAGTRSGRPLPALAHSSDGPSKIVGGSRVQRLCTRPAPPRGAVRVGIEPKIAMASCRGAELEPRCAQMEGRGEFHRIHPDGCGRGPAPTWPRVSMGKDQTSGSGSNFERDGRNSDSSGARKAPPFSGFRGPRVDQSDSSSRPTRTVFSAERRPCRATSVGFR